MVRDERVALVSATGSVRMGREVGPVVAERFGRVLLELGGNNGAIVAPSADIDLALRGVVFAAAGTAGQRCTTLRRLIVHESIADDFVDKIVAAYKTLSIGSPTEDGVLVGPLINEGSYEAMQAALKQAESEGGTVLTGGARVLDDERPDAHYVEPAVVRMPTQTSVMESETFAPILYVVTYSDLDEALEIHNGVPQGLSSAIFTSELAESEKFLSRSDCGIANVNIGTSGAEIGGPSAVRRKPAAAASPAPIRGRPICARRRTRSTTQVSCRWRRAWSSSEGHLSDGIVCCHVWEPTAACLVRLRLDCDRHRRHRSGYLVIGVTDSVESRCPDQIGLGSLHHRRANSRIGRLARPSPQSPRRVGAIVSETVLAVDQCRENPGVGFWPTPVFYAPAALHQFQPMRRAGRR